MEDLGLKKSKKPGESYIYPPGKMKKLEKTCQIKKQESYKI